MTTLSGVIASLTDMIEITESTEVTPELVEAFERLTPQLSRSNPPPTSGELAEIAASDATVLLVARDSDRQGADAIVGSLTLALFRIPTGLRAWIEDVVVDESVRGQGVGDALNRCALEVARMRGARTVDLTSRPSREAANRLYRRLGFEPRETNVYRYDL
jgi:ribosomal protein S18 acetylase RimI-like enzyme